MGMGLVFLQMTGDLRRQEPSTAGMFSANLALLPATAAVESSMTHLGFLVLSQRLLDEAKMFSFMLKLSRIWRCQTRFKQSLRLFFKFGLKHRTSKAAIARFETG